MLTSETPSTRSVERSTFSQSRACSGERTSGSVTISTSGVPPRLKSTTLTSEPRSGRSRRRGPSLAASSSRCTRCMRTSPREPPAAQRNVVLRYLVALRKIRVEVVLAVKDRPRRDLTAEREADHASPKCTARALVTGSVPGESQTDGAGVDVRLVAERTARSRRTSLSLSTAERGSPARSRAHTERRSRAGPGIGRRRQVAVRQARRTLVERAGLLQRIGGIEQPRSR